MPNKYIIAIKAFLSKVASAATTILFFLPRTIAAWRSKPAPAKSTHSEIHTAMVISTQKAKDSDVGKPGVAQGRTGLAIQQLTGGGFVHVHRDKTIRPEEKDIFTKHLRAGGWLIITGHGADGLPHVSGRYGNLDVDVTCAVQDYVNMIKQSNTLKSGDHINILLYVCFAAANYISPQSYAERLGKEFAKNGITTTIVGSVKPVYRISDFDPKYGDIRGKQLAFRADKKDIRVIATNQKGNSTTRKGNANFFISAEKIGFQKTSVKQTIKNTFRRSP